MKDFIACLLLFALFMLGLYYERKDKKRKEYEEWIYFRRICLKNISRNFHDDCQALAEAALTQYTNKLVWRSYNHSPDYMLYSFIDNYNESIKKLKSEYVDNFSAKYSNGNEKLMADALPKHIIEEYEKDIADIASTFLDLGSIMRKQIAELKEKL